jgi:hypothetical protein
MTSPEYLAELAALRGRLATLIVEAHCLGVRTGCLGVALASLDGALRDSEESFVPTFNDAAPVEVRWVDRHTDETLRVRQRDGATVSVQDSEGRVVLLSERSVEADLRGLAERGQL